LTAQKPNKAHLQGTPTPIRTPRGSGFGLNPRLRRRRPRLICRYWALGVIGGIIISFLVK